MKKKQELIIDLAKFFKNDAEVMLKEYEQLRIKRIIPVTISTLLSTVVLVSFLLIFITGGFFMILVVPVMVAAIIIGIVFQKTLNTDDSEDILDYEMFIKRKLMYPFLELFGNGFNWNKLEHNAEIEKYNRLTENLEITPDNIFKYYDDIIWNDTLAVPIRIIEISNKFCFKSLIDILVLIVTTYDKEKNSHFFIKWIFLVIFVLIITLWNLKIINLTPLILPLFLSLFIIPGIRLLFQLKLFSKKSRYILISFKIPKPIKAHTIILEKHKILNPKNKLEKFEKINLEDVDFNSSYNTYSTNQIEARYLLTTSFISRFENIKTSFRAKKIRAEFVGNELFLMLETGKDMFKMGSLTNETTFRTFEIMLDEMYSVLSLSEQLNVETKL